LHKTAPSNWMEETLSSGRPPSMLKAAGSSTLFLFQNGVSLWNEYCDLKVFWSGRIIHFMKNILFRRNGETHVSYGKKQSVLEAGVSCRLFQMRPQLPFERNTAYL
jgi:hypothetical protein